VLFLESNKLTSICWFDIEANCNLDIHHLTYSLSCIPTWALITNQTYLKYSNNLWKLINMLTALIHIPIKCTITSIINQIDITVKQ